MDSAHWSTDLSDALTNALTEIIMTAESVACINSIPEHDLLIFLAFRD